MKPVDRRTFIRHVAAGTSVVAAGGASSIMAGCTFPGPTDETRGQDTPGTRSSTPDHPAGDLADLAYTPLRLGSVKPRGWLERQLRIQAGGLTGHLDQFWPDVAESQWFGGDADGWERAPYWLDGAIPLAWTLDDASLKARVAGYIDHIVAHQRPDGWFEPVPEDPTKPTAPGGRPYDMWAILLMQKVLAQYHDATGDDRVFASLEASLRALDRSLQDLS